MKSLAFLWLCKAKNRLKEIIRKPGQLIFLLLMVVALVFTAFSPGSEPQFSESFRDINELYRIVFLLYAIVFVMVSKNGFYNGASMFSMADVNMLFTSPLKSSKILSFGLFQQLGRSVLIGYFILFQSATVKGLYGVGFSALLFILLGYAVTVFLAQMTAMLIYSFTCSDDRRCKILKAVYYGTIAVFAGYVILRAWLIGGFHAENLVTAAGEPFARFFPVAGFAALAVEGAIGGEAVKILIGAVCTVLFCLIYYIIVSRTNSDYYEDVLKATEVSFSAVTARKEGKVQENAPRNIKVGKIGLPQGVGAAAIAAKHRVENRRSKFLVLDMMSFVTIGVTAVFALIVKEPFAYFPMSLYMAMIGAGASRWSREFSMPYVYLIPESPTKKLFYMIKSDIPSIILESVLCFTVLHFVDRTLPIAHHAGMAVARISFSFMIIGVNILLQRMFGNSDKKFLVITVYFLLVMLFCLPGVGAAVLMGYILPFFYWLPYLAMAFVNLLVFLALMFAGRNILEYAEYNNK
ncbi:MAG: putative ABC exporter domain-containing protein [Oscillospiraceae bacterium]|nr:putative ABC exporter domain-containing protein [Oscillospiraceae bacterium]